MMDSFGFWKIKNEEDFVLDCERNDAPFRGQSFDIYQCRVRFFRKISRFLSRIFR